MYNLLPFGWLLFASAISCLTQAQGKHNAVSPSDNQGIETTEVYGVKSRQPSGITLVDNSRYTGFNQTIDRSQFEGRFVNFGEMLNRLPGIQVKQSGGFGSNVQVAIRGTGNKRVNIFLDGMPMNSSASGNAKLQYIPSVLIERIDTYPYFTPLELGNANLGGAVNFTTRDIEKAGAGGQISAGYGSFSTTFADASSWGSADGYQGMIGVGFLDSANNFKTRQKAFLSRFDTRDGSRMVERQNDAIQRQSVFFKGGKDWDNPALNLLVQHHAVEKELPTSVNDDTDDARLFEDNLAIQSLVDYAYNGWQWGHRPFFMQESTLLEDLNSKIGRDANKTRMTTDKWGLASHVKKPFDQHHLAINLEWQKDNLKRRDEIRNTRDIHTDRESLILSASDHWTVTPAVKLASVIRYYKVKDATRFPHDPDENRLSENAETAWHSGLSWKINEQLGFNSNLGESIRIPTLYEKFGSAGLYEGDPDLKREKATSFDMGFNYAHRSIDSGINGFVSQIEDGIVFIYDSGGVGHPENIGKAMIGGVAFDMTFSPYDWLVLGGNATLILSENLGKQADTDNRRMPGIYHNSLNTFVSFIGSWIEWHIHYSQDGELYYEATNDPTLKADDKQLLDTSLIFYFEPFSLDLTARNLLDENYRDFDFQPTPRQSFMATLTVDI